MKRLHGHCHPTKDAVARRRRASHEVLVSRQVPAS